MNKLVIAEKPSMARSLSAVLGATQKQAGYLKGNGYLVSWCIGHLVELAAPAAYDEKYAKWRTDDLPILPAPWQYVVTEVKKPQFNILRSLMNAPNVESIICATDAGREGELIFRLVYKICECKKPVERLWISSMEDAAVAEGFRKLKPDKAYDRLYHAALCRAQADWLVGINATRLYSTMYNQTLNIGRVMTPTLAMLVERETRIAAFQSVRFYNVLLNCGNFTATGERLSDRAEAERIAALCDGGAARINKLECKEYRENPPKLYDLTSLQRDANQLLGYTAQQTLDYAQALYERKLATYPRTDSHFLTRHMEDGVQSLVDTVRNALPFARAAPVPCSIAQVIDDGKVSDHHAILPTAAVTGEAILTLPNGEQSILTLLMTRLLCAVGNPCRFNESIATMDCKGIAFSAKGRKITEMGWKAIEKAHLATLNNLSVGELSILPALHDHMTFLPVNASVKEGKTTPPKSFTEATLLSAMEMAGTDNMPEEAERKGLGTPATRAGIIEKLVKAGFMERKGGKKGHTLLPTQKAVSLIAVLPEELQSPRLTAEWEQKLGCIEHGEIVPDAFMRDITELVRKIISTGHPVPNGEMLFADTRKSIGVCPRCGSAIVERPKGFLCSNRSCRFALWRDNHFFTSKKKELTAAIAIALLKDGRALVKGLYSRKTGKTYDATVVLDDTGEQYVDFKLEFP